LTASLVLQIGFCLAPRRRQNRLVKTRLGGCAITDVFAFTDLAVIVSSHDLLQAWNNLNESALRADGKRHNAQLVNNIQSTAALIPKTEKDICSQNFEFMRALNLYEKTLSPVDVAKGFVSGIGNKITDIAKQATAFTEPEDINLQHAQARVDALLSKPQKIAGTINILWQNPGILSKAFQAELSEARQSLVQSMVGEHPTIAIGSELGAITTSIIVNSINPTNKATVIKRANDTDVKR